MHVATRAGLPRGQVSDRDVLRSTTGRAIAYQPTDDRGACSFGCNGEEVERRVAAMTPTGHGDPAATVSVVIPSNRGGSYLADAVASVKRQAVPVRESMNQ